MGTDEDTGRAEVEAADKRVQTLQARFALQGWACHVIGPDRVLVCRWNRTRECSLAEAEDMVRTVEGRRDA